MGNLMLILTILFETLAVVSMKLSVGFQHRFWTILSLLTYAGSFVFLTFALKKMPAGIANAIWAGASTVLVAVISVLFLNERLNVIQLVSLAFIIIGLVGLHYDLPAGLKSH